MEQTQIYDIAILGAGAAGLMCASNLHDKKIVIIEGNKKVGVKLLATGGGSCNFTNANVSKNDYFSQNPDFCRSALAGFTPQNFIDLLKGNHIYFTQKAGGKFFAKSAQNILDMLLAHIDKNTTFALNNKISTVVKNGDLFEVKTNKNTFFAKNIICALGGLSYAPLGATHASYDIAKSFALELTPLHPALTSIFWPPALAPRFSALAGISCKAKITFGKINILGDILFTHDGLSGPAIFDLTLHDVKNQEIKINFLPDIDVKTLFMANKNSLKNASSIISGLLPKHLTSTLLDGIDVQMTVATKAQISALVTAISALTFKVLKTGPYAQAEVTCGGISTKDINSKTMQSKISGLYFIGECLDVTGRLGGFNLHWAWASAIACSRALNLLHK